MKWTDMQGPIGPILHSMARYYAERSNLDVDDLVQEAWLNIYRRPDARMTHAAFSAMTNAVAKERTYRKYLKGAGKPVCHEPRNRVDSRLDVATILGECDLKDIRILYLRFWKGETVKSTAEILGISPRSIVERARKIRDRWNA